MSTGKLLLIINRYLPFVDTTLIFTGKSLLCFRSYLRGYFLLTPNPVLMHAHSPKVSLVFEGACLPVLVGLTDFSDVFVAREYRHLFALPVIHPLEPSSRLTFGNLGLIFSGSAISEREPNFSRIFYARR